MTNWPKQRVMDLMVAEGDRFDVPLSSEARTLLYDYALLLQRWNRRIRLVGRSSMPEIVQVHLADSLALAHCLRLVAERDHGACPLIDVGSGAGLPGLLVAMASTDLLVTLCEITQKRIAFLSQAAAPLRERVTVLHQDVWTLPEEARVFRHAVSRAVFEPDTWLELGLTLVRPGGWVWSMLTDRQSAAQTQPDLNFEYQLADGRSRCIRGRRR